MLNVSAVDPAACKKILIDNMSNWTPEKKDLKAYLDWVLERFYEDRPDEAKALILSLNTPEAEDRLTEVIKIAIFKASCMEEIREIDEVHSVMQGAFESIEKEQVGEADVMPYRLALSLLRESDQAA